MSFEAVLGNTEFELIVFGVTFAVVTRRSASGHGVSVLSSPFSNQGLPEVNEFLFIHPKPQCLHIVYTIIIQLFPLEILDFFNEVKKVGLGGVNPTAVLGNKEFELVVFGVTFAVVQLLGMVYQYLVSVTGRVDST
jgi:hypothetical protein